jgi:predicted exporter
MALSICALLGAMSLVGISWNIFSLAAILLLLGTGTDYSMMMFLALKRSGGDACAARRDVSLVIALCALSAVAGFGSVGFASHAGLATLGKVAAMGLALNAAVALFLVPLAVRRAKVMAHPAPSTNRM